LSLKFKHRRNLVICEQILGTPLKIYGMCIESTEVQRVPRKEIFRKKQS